MSHAEIASSALHRCEHVPVADDSQRRPRPWHRPRMRHLSLPQQRVRAHAQVGLNYVCHTAERFFAVQKCLVTLVESLQQAPSVRLLKHIIRCFLRLTDNARAREALRTHTPMLLLEPDFTACLKDDGQTRQ